MADTWRAALLLVITTHGASAMTLEARMAMLSAAMGDEIAYAEEAHSPVFAVAQTSRGVMAYDRQTHTLTKRVIEPEPITMEVGDREVRVIRAEREQRFSLRKRPELAALLNTFRALAEGDAAALRDHFSLDYTESEDAWRLQLTPSSRRLQRYVETIIIDGQEDRIESICTRQDADQWRHMTLLAAEPVAMP